MKPVKSELILDNVNTLSKKSFTFLNHFSFVRAYKNIEKYCDIDYFACDGILLYFFLKMRGIKVSRCSFDFSSLADDVFEILNLKSSRIAIVGGSETDCRRFTNLISTKYSNLEIIFSRSGYFEKKEDYENALIKIKELNPEFLLVGMGAPIQEKFLKDLSKINFKTLSFTCGAFISQTANKGEAYYPAFFQALNMRWLYRIYKEPRLIHRYTVYVLIFLYLYICDLVSKRIISIK